MRLITDLILFRCMVGLLFACSVGATGPAAAQGLAEVSGQSGWSAPGLRLAPFVDVGAGSLYWAIGDRTVESELDYQDVGSAEAGLEARWDLLPDSRGSWRVEGAVARGWVVTGVMRDSDFRLGVEKRRFRADLEGAGSGFESIAVGRNGRPSLPGAESGALLVGWARRWQVLRMRNGLQLFPLRLRFPDLDSRYAFEWEGPWVAYEITFAPDRSSAITGRGTLYVPTRYEAEGQWNLREEFAQPRSFAQDGYGHGWSVRLRYARGLTESLRLAVTARHERARAADGNDRVYFVDGRSHREDLRNVDYQWTAVSFAIDWALAGGSAGRDGADP